jgi:hypothetical protein
MSHAQNVLAAPGVAARARARVPRANPRALGRRAPRSRGAVSSGAAADDRATDFADASVIANNAASLDGKLRTLVVGVEDAQGDERLNHRNPTSGTLFKHRRWLDDYVVPGQHVTLVDLDSGKQVTLPVSVSPYRARATAPNADVSVVEFLLDADSDDGDENFFAKTQPPARLVVSRVHGSGFENPLFPKDFNLKAAVDAGHAIVLLAGGARGMGPMRAALEWPIVASHADKHPVTLFYLHAGARESNGASSAFVQEWDEWRGGGVAVVPLYGDKPGFTDQPGDTNGGEENAAMSSALSDASSAVLAVRTAIAGGAAAEFGGKGRKALGDDPSATTVLMAGLTREETKTMFAVFADTHGVPKSNIIALPETRASGAKKS